MAPQVSYYSCAPGLMPSLFKEPSSKTRNLALIEKVAKDFADKLGKPHTIYRESLGVWHSFKIVQPSPTAVAEAKAAKAKKADTRRETRRQEVYDNPFLELAVDQRCKLEAYLIRYLLPEAITLPPDRRPSDWLAQRLPELVHQ